MPRSEVAAADPERIEQARRLTREALVIDGLVFHSDGWTDTLQQAGVDAINLTVSTFIGDFEEACDGIAQWLSRLRRADSPWRHVREADDIIRAREEGRIGLIMGWQNMRPIADKLDRLAMFYELGLRVMQPTYNERNFLGDGCLEPADGGLSLLGRRAVREMNGLGILVDLSHVGERSCLDAVEATTKPVAVTHANAKAVSDVPRNKSDEVIKAVAATGGVIGVSVYGPMCWNGDPGRRPLVSDFVAHGEHIAEVAGPDHVSLGTDFPAVRDLSSVDAVIRTTLDRYPAAISSYAKAFGNDVRTRYPEDCSSHLELHHVTAALLARGWSEEQVRGLLGKNLMRVLREVL